jgi:hypothetical protein
MWVRRAYRQAIAWALAKHYRRVNSSCQKQAGQFTRAYRVGKVAVTDEEQAVPPVSISVFEYRTWDIRITAFRAGFLLFVSRTVLYMIIAIGDETGSVE